MKRKDYWNYIINNLDIDSLAIDLHSSWEKESSSCKSSTIIPEEWMTNLPPIRSVLDFGVGLGRNYEYLKNRFSEVWVYDLPPMLERLKSIRQDIYNFVYSLDDFPEVDLVYSTLCFQHMDLEDLKVALDVISSKAKFLFLYTRSYNDVGRDFVNKTGGQNVISLIEQYKPEFKVVESIPSYEIARELLDETHITVFYKLI